MSSPTQQTNKPSLAFRLKNFALGGIAGMCATSCVSQFFLSFTTKYIDPTNRYGKGKNLGSFR